MQKLIARLGKLALSLAIAFAFGYGFYGLFTYALPLSKNDFRQAMSSVVADETEVLINGAAQEYEQGNYEDATKALELALDKMVTKSGQHKLQDRWKLERVYFLLGKSYHRQKQFDKAAENYKETLRLNPNHLFAKYNLEMLEPPPSSGGNGGTPPAPGKIQPKI